MLRSWREAAQTTGEWTVPPSLPLGLSLSQQRSHRRNLGICSSLTGGHLARRLCVDFCTTSMMTSSNGNIFRVTGPLCGEFTSPGEFPSQRPVARSFDVFFDLRLNKRLSKQPWGWWFETLSCPLWRHGNASWNRTSRERSYTPLKTLQPFCVTCHLSQNKSGTTLLLQSFAKW